MSSRTNGEMRSSSRRSTSSSGRARPLSLEEVCAGGAPPPPLSLRDRVVWLSDNGPEFGYVKWLGQLPDVGNDWMAGVDFDNAVGSGTGLYNDYQLFEAPMNHASLVPVIGLMKAEDFGGGDPNKRSPTPPSTADHSCSKSSSQARIVLSRPTGRSRDALPPVQTAQTSSTSTSSPLASKNSQQLNLSESSSEAEESCKSAQAGKSLSPSVPDARECRDGRDASTQSTMTQSSPPLQRSMLTVLVNGKSPPLPESPVGDVELESLVEVIVDEVPRFGVIRWIGCLDSPDSAAVSERNTEPLDDGSGVRMAGVELEEECVGCCDGSWNGRRYFSCAPRRGVFVPLSECKRDSRFDMERRRSTAFGSIDCPSVPGDVPPLCTPDELKALCGKNRGIQGHHNSCYLDATLFAMFSCTTIFESLLYRPPTRDDIPEYAEVQRVLKEEIVNPLRCNLYVRADRVMHLRTLLERLSSVRGLTSEEKDPEELLNLLLNEILKAQPFLQLSSGLSSFFYQLFVEKDDKLLLPTVQQLFDQSFLASNIKLRQVPPALLVQMPRFGRQFKMYPRIVPSLYLDITDVLEDSPRQCCICGHLAQVECRDCFGLFGQGLESTAFCTKCLDKSHGHKKRTKHQLTTLRIPNQFVQLKEHASVPRVYMELFAVLCIETSHYVAFVKCGSGPDAPWCFFDSMADRKGEQHGYNIPEVVSFSDLRWWLSEEGNVFLLATKDDKVLPEMARRLLCDAYMCFYQSTDIMMYR